MFVGGRPQREVCRSDRQPGPCHTLTWPRMDAIGLRDTTRDARGPRGAMLVVESSHRFGEWSRSGRAKNECLAFFLFVVGPLFAHLMATAPFLAVEHRNGSLRAQGRGGMATA